MDKVKMEYVAPKTKKIEYRNVEFELIPFISHAEMVVLINQYIKDYFSRKDNIVIETCEYHYFEAEVSLKNYILQLNTNIDIRDINNDFYFDNGFWTIITSNILNYVLFYEILTKIINDIKDQLSLQKSIGNVIDNVAEKIYDLIYKLSETTPEEVEKIRQQGVEMLQQLADNPIVSDMSRGTASEQKAVRKPRKK